MKLSVPFRVCAGLCLYGAIACALPILDSCQLALAVETALVFLGLLAAARCAHLLPRVLLSLIGAASLLFARGWLNWAVLGAPLVWLLLLSATDRLEAEHWQYLRVFPAQALAAGVLLLVNLAIGPIRPACMCFAGLCLLLGVMALRLARMGDGADLRWTAMNLAELALPLGAACGAGVLILGLARLLGPVLSLILTPFVHLLKLITELVDSGFQHLGEESGITDDFFLETAPSSPILSPSGGSSAAEQLPQPASLPDTAWDKILLGLGALVILVILTVLIVRLLRRERVSRRAESDYEIGTHFRFRSGKRRREKAGSNAEKVRAIYREYLTLMRRRGLNLFRSTTSEDVLAYSGLSDSDEAALRQIYLLARYDRDGQAVSDQQLKQAEEILKRLQHTEP